MSQLEVAAHRPLRGMYGEDEDDEVYAEKARMHACTHDSCEDVVPCCVCRGGYVWVCS